MAALVLAQGCATQSEVQVAAPAPIAGKVLAIRIEPCTDRTNTRERNLSAEATRLLTNALRTAPEFVLRDDATTVLNCEVTQFVEGSAIKRWVMPGWGSTVGQISVMVSTAKDSSAIAIIHGNATVSGGGLYTIGAEDYILKSAADDVVAKLRAWLANPTPPERR